MLMIIVKLNFQETKVYQHYTDDRNDVTELVQCAEIKKCD
jgi:hypothetical protein